MPRKSNIIYPILFPNSIVRNKSILTNFSYFSNEMLYNIRLTIDDIIPLIRSLNPNKAIGSDGIPFQILLFCDETVVLPLKIIFSNILPTGVYPDIWKFPNVTPIFKKGDFKQLIKNYRPISLPILGKIREKIISYLQ